MSAPSPLKANWTTGDDYDPNAANTVAAAVNWLLANGTGGSGGVSTLVAGEIPVGNQDGENEAFSLAHAFVTGSTCVYRNGLRERLGAGYTESSPRIIFTTPPLPSDVIEVDYQIA